MKKLRNKPKKNVPTGTRAREPRRRRKQEPAAVVWPEFIQGLTGHTRKDWIAHVQGLIAKHTSASGRFEGHGETDTTAWLMELLFDVQRCAPPQGRTIKTAYDGNMWVALSLGYILLLWAMRVKHAKSQDPNRPVDVRRWAHDAWLRSAIGICGELILDDRQDGEHFPGQKWNHPYLPGAKGGKFL